MKKIFVSLLVILSMAACSGFLNSDEHNGLQASPEALSAGGYISSDEYNEICPFIFRTVNDDVYLFFSSDRNGSYDIFWSKMDVNGMFGTPTALYSPLNYSTWDEIFPVVYYAWGDITLALLRVQGAVTNLLVYTLETNFYTNAYYDHDWVSNISATGLGYYNDKDNSEGEFLISSGNNSVQVWAYDGSVYLNKTLVLSSHPVSISMVRVKTNTGGNAIDFMLMGQKNRQLTTEAQSYTNGGNTLALDILFYADDYDSPYNDITPYIDYRGGFKVYFASDRYGKGNYDLYRYNEVTFNTLSGVKEFYIWDPAPQVQINFPADYYTNFSDMITVNADAASANPFPFMEMYCALDSQAYQKMTPGTGWAYSFSAVPAGVHSIKVYGIDTFRRVSAVKMINTVITN